MNRCRTALLVAYGPAARTEQLTPVTVEGAEPHPLTETSAPPPPLLWDSPHIVNEDADAWPEDVGEGDSEASCCRVCTIQPGVRGLVHLDPPSASFWDVRTWDRVDVSLPISTTFSSHRQASA